MVSLIHGSRVDSAMSKRELEDVGRQLSQHVVGMNPSELGYPDQNAEPKEEEQDEEKENETKESKACKLIHQEFLHDPTMTAGEFMLSKDLQMVDFVRFECGESKEE